MKSLYRILTNPLVYSIFFLGFASGLPLALSTATLSAWFTKAGISLMGIGMLSLIGQPYVYKFIWAPLMDRVIPPFLGRRRGWILITQILLIMSIAILGFMQPTEHLKLMTGLALLVAFFSASQDISISALMADAPREEERGLVAAAYITGYRIAMIVSGALALIIAQHWGWHVTYLCMSALMLIGVVTTFATKEPTVIQPKQHDFYHDVIQPFTEFFSRKGLWVAIAIILVMILYKLGDAFTVSLGSTFLLRHLHFTLTDVGTMYKVVGLTSSIVGGIIGGLLMTRLSLFRALFIFGILQTVTNLLYMWLAIVGHHMGVLAITVSGEAFCDGLGNTAFVALILTLCNPKFSATQFALLSALTAIGRVYVGPVAAEMVQQLGWTWFYFWCFVIGLPGVFLLIPLRRHLTRQA